MKTRKDEIKIYMLNLLRNNYALNYSDIARKFNVTREWVRQIAEELYNNVEFKMKCVCKYNHTWESIGFKNKPVIKLCPVCKTPPVFISKKDIFDWKGEIVYESAKNLQDM